MPDLKPVWNATKKLEMLSRRLFMGGWPILSSKVTLQVVRPAMVLEVLMLRRQIQP
jgi:hypothetical protein